MSKNENVTGHHGSSNRPRGIDTAVIDAFQVRTSATFGPEFDAELDRLVEAAHKHIIDGEYESWGPRMEHELRAALRRMLVMETPAEEIVDTLRIAEFGELSRQQDQQQPAHNGSGTSETSPNGSGDRRSE
jgi:hypothetical protein